MKYAAGQCEETQWDEPCMDRSPGLLEILETELERLESNVLRLATCTEPIRIPSNEKISDNPPTPVPINRLVGLTERFYHLNSNLSALIGEINL